MSAEDVDVAIAKSIAEDDDTEILVGCVPISHRPSVPSLSATCAQCGSMIWVSARVLDVLPERGKLLCLYCVAADVGTT